MTRYRNLRDSVAYFAATAEEQLAHDWGADEAVNDTPYPLEIMLELAEITPAEAEMIRKLEDLIGEYCSQSGSKPWDDEAMLFSDPLWAQIRCLAANVLQQLPNEERESNFTRS